MEEVVVEYQLAKLAHNKGFDIVPQFGMESSLYDQNGKHCFYANYGRYSVASKKYIPAPTLSFLQTWLRVEKKIDCEASSIILNRKRKYLSIIAYAQNTLKSFDSYELALTDAVTRGLKMLKNVK